MMVTAKWWRIQLLKMSNIFTKNQLQTFAQKRNLAFPVYTCNREGPIHASQCRCKVEIDGKTYDIVEFFCSTKEAEHLAAKIALSSLSKSDVKEGGFQMHKNLLQEFCQKQGYELPVYRTSRRCEVQTPTFILIVEVSEESFTEQRSSTKKMGEMNAAKVAYTILKERKASQNSTPQHSLLRGQSSFYFPLRSVSSASNLGDVVSETAGGFATCTPHNGQENWGKVFSPKMFPIVIVNLCLENRSIESYSSFL